MRSTRLEAGSHNGMYFELPTNAERFQSGAAGNWKRTPTNNWESSHDAVNRVVLPPARCQVDPHGCLSFNCSCFAMALSLEHAGLQTLRDWPGADQQPNLTSYPTLLFEF